MKPTKPKTDARSTCIIDWRFTLLFTLLAGLAVFFTANPAFAQEGVALPEVSLLREAGKAFGILFTVERMFFLLLDVVLGLVGLALLLGISIPILRPVILHIGSPELLAFCVFGLSLAAVLNGVSMLKGLAGVFDQPDGSSPMPDRGTRRNLPV